MDRVYQLTATCARAARSTTLRAGCRSVYYSAPEPQRADWKSHEVASKAATAEREVSQIARVVKDGGSAPAAAPERIGHPASLYVAGVARAETEALYQLGVCYYRGQGVRQSYERAAELLQQAAAKGNVGAQAWLGTFYHEGKGVPQSYERAAELYQQAASKGYSRAQACLGTLHRYGLGVPQSYERAAELYQQAAAQGLVYARAQLEDLRGA